MGTFSGICVRIAAARSTIRLAQSSLIRRLRSASGCFSIYAFLRFNTSLRQLQCEIEVTYKTIHRRVERFTEALDAPSLDLVGPVEIDEFYVSAGLKGRERDCWSRSRGLSRRRRGTYEQDKRPVFVLVDRGTEQRYVVPAKSADESTIRLLLADRQQDPQTVYTDGFCAYNPLEGDERFDREYVVHGDGKYADDTVHVNTCESHASLARRWLSRTEESQKIASHSISERSNSGEKSTANPDEKRSNTPSKPLSEINNVLHKSGLYK